MIAHCESMGDRMAILDPPPGLNAQQVHDWRVEHRRLRLASTRRSTGRGCNVLDPATGRNTPMPPSGAHRRHLGAQRRHPRRAQGARRTRSSRRARRRDPHHPRRARPAQPGRRQLHPRLPRPRHPGLGCAHAVQRPGLALRQRAPAVQLHRVVDPRRHPVGGLRAQRPRPVGRIRRTITAFLYRVWRDGALFGATPEQAFYVKCDDETNPSEVIEAGQVVCEIGVAAGEAGRVRRLPPRPAAERHVRRSPSKPSAEQPGERHAHRRSIPLRHMRSTSRSTPSRSPSSRRSSGLSISVGVIEHKANKLRGQPDHEEAARHGEVRRHRAASAARSTTRRSGPGSSRCRTGRSTRPARTARSCCTTTPAARSAGSTSRPAGRRRSRSASCRPASDTVLLETVTITHENLVVG